MLRKLVLSVVLSAVTFAAHAATALVPGQDRDHQFLMTRHVRDEVRAAAPVGRLPATQRLQFDMVLPLRAPAALESFLADVYNPKSPSYRHFITPAEFTERFGPSAADWDELVAFAKRSGFTIQGGSRDEMDLRLSGTVAAVETAFHVTMRTYQHPTEPRTYYSADAEPTVAMQAEVWHISGLDNFTLPRARLQVRQHDATTAHPLTWTGGCPGNSYCGSDMRAAYYGGTALTGAGQSVGLVEYYGYDIADLNTYFTNAGQANSVPVNGISTDGTSVSCVHSQGCDDTEQTLDMTQAIGMAPGLAQLNVYVGSSDTAILSAMSVVPPHSVTGKVDAQLSCSWGWGPGDPSVDDPYFQKFAAQGQSFLTAAGDSGAYTTGSRAVFPADDAYVTVVGGTDLATGGAGGPWSGETAWSDGGGGNYAADNVLIPSWQKAAIAQYNAVSSRPGSTVLRNSPDVSAEANFDFYVCSNQTTCVANSYGGTSFAAPMWAGYLALANQQAVANGQPTVGFLNPTLYAIGAAGGSAYSAAFHDVTSGTNGYPTASGYDLATGWGSPNGTGLITALAGSSTPGFSLAASGTATVSAGGAGSVTVTSAASGGFSGAIALAVSGAPAGVTATFSPASINAGGSAQLAFTVPAGTAAGSYPLTLSGSSAATATTPAVKSTATLTLTITNASFTLSSPGTVSANDGASGTVAITAKASGGFTGAIALSASGAPAGVSLSFSPASITTSGTSTATVHVASGVPGGTYPLVVTGSGGSLQNSVTLTLTVVPPGFTLSSSATLAVAEANQGTVTVRTTATGGLASAIALSASGLPAGVTASFSPASISGSGTSSAVFAVSATVPSGSYPLTISGNNAATGITASTSLTLNVTASGFALVPASSAVSVVQGQSVATSIADRPTGGFAGPIALSASGQPAGMTVTFSPATITSAGGSATATFAPTASVATGSYPVTITGTSEGVTQSTTVTVTVAAPTFTLSGGVAVSLPQGGSGSATVASHSSNGYGAAIALSATGQPSGVTVGFTPASINGVGSASLALQVAPGTTAGVYPITITGSGGGLTATTTLTLTVTVPSFSLAASASAPAVIQGGSGTLTLTSKAAGGFASPIQLGATGQPDGVAISFSPATLAASGSTSVSLKVAAGTPAGSYPLAITGTSGVLSTSVNVTLNITAAGFTLTAPATSIAVQQGSGGSISLATTMTGTLAAPVTLSVTPPAGAASAAAVTLGTSSLMPPGTVPVGIAVPVGVTPGSYPFSIVATSGTLTQTLNLTLVVTAPSPPLFSFSPSTTALTLTHGTSTSFSVQAQSGGTATPAIALALTGLPSGVTASFSPATISGSGTATVTLTAAASARTSSPATAVLAASAGGSTQTCSLSLTVN